MMEIRNLAYRRRAYQSSSYSVNETVQLITVGLEPVDESKMAYDFLHRDGNKSRYGNVKYLFEPGVDTEFQNDSSNTWVQVRLPRKTILGSYSLTAGSVHGERNPFPSRWRLEGSADGEVFELIDCQVNQDFEEYEDKTYPVREESPYTHYRLHIEQVKEGDRIHLASWVLRDRNGKELLASYEENLFACVSAWMSAGNQEEWVYVDLGAESLIERAVVHWGSMFATVCELQVSMDAEAWRTIAADQNGTGGSREFVFERQKARYVKLLLKETDPDNIAYIIREFQVFGSNEAEPHRKKAPKREEGKQFLNLDPWTIGRAEDRNLSGICGEMLSSVQYDDSGWLPATVPGTVFLSYLNAGAVADPCYGDWQRCASDSYFKSDFWYRTSFNVSGVNEKKNIWLNFDAVNWKARIYLNGAWIGGIDGGFIRGCFDITPYTRLGEKNHLAVRILRNTDPGTAYTSNNQGPGTMGGVFGNDGRMGEDAPTYSAAGGWDWVPTVRGRNIGIYNDVYLTFTDSVKAADPWAVTTFARHEDGSFDLSKAYVNVMTEIQNGSNHKITAVIRAEISHLEELVREEIIELEAGETVQVRFPSVVLSNPEVWWPNGYGGQPLYELRITALVNDNISDSKKLQFGVREFTYTCEESEETDPNGYRNGRNLAILCNGIPVVIRGGNWGLEDIHLDVDARTYDDKIRLHKLENFNMIRNWGGQTNDEELYRACDKYGIMIWDDFFFPGCWLHLPRDPGMFLTNAEDKIRSYRSHACLVLYCGANETYIEIKEIETGIRDLLERLDGTRHYIPHSAKAPVSEDGPHKAMPPEFYFNSTFPGMINSERGMPNIPVEETMKKMFPAKALWPHNKMWSLHDFALSWNVDGAGYLEKLKCYGDFHTFQEMIRRAQMQGYELHKAMFEGALATETGGLMMWMSNPVWPTLVWQSYDYYHDVNGGYCGIKTACQPIHLIWNRADDTVILFNGTPYSGKLTCRVRFFDIHGSQIHELCKMIYSGKASRTEVFRVDFSCLSQDFVFMQLEVIADRNALSALEYLTIEPGEKESASGAMGYQAEENKLIGRNFYWHNHMHPGNYNILAELPFTDVDVQAREIGGDIVFGLNAGGMKRYQVTMENNSDTPALLLRIKVLNRVTGERVLPVFYEDNDISLMPGESRKVCLEFHEEDLNGGEAEFYMEGFNCRHGRVIQNV